MVFKQEVVTSLLKRIDNLQNNTNKQILQEYHKFLVDCDKSQNSPRNTMKLVLLFSNFLQQQQERNNNNNFDFLQIKSKEIILEFLDSKKIKIICIME